MSDWFDVRSTPTVKEARGPVDEQIRIETREGVVWAEPGDYVIREADGNEYPIGPEKFAEYYERVDESPINTPCPKCGLELGPSPGWPGVYWCEGCELEYWKRGGEWLCCGEDGKPRYVSDPGDSEGEQ